MNKKKKISIIFTGILIVLIVLSIIPTSSKINYKNEEPIEYPSTSSSLEGSEKIIATNINREATLSDYGVTNIIDSITFKNKNKNPINSIFLGIPLSVSEKLIFFEARGEQDNSLLIERSNYIMENFEMIAIYFETPLLPEESKEIKFVQTYMDMIKFLLEVQTGIQKINFTSYAFPILPYKAEGLIKASYEIPDSSSLLSSSEWATPDPSGKTVIYQVSEVDPFLENLIKEHKEYMNVFYSDNTITKLEVEEVNREIYINPFGIIKVKEEYSIRNKGLISIDTLEFKIPGPAKAVYVFDDFGEILGTEIDPVENYYNLTYKDLTIDLSINRVRINPDTRFRFNIQYFLPYEKYLSINWFQESIKMDILTSVYEYLGKDQTIKIQIEGCYSLDSISEPPSSIENSQNLIILVYESDYVSPLETKKVQFTFTINYFDSLLRPIIFVIIVALLSSAYVIAIKSRKEEAIVGIRKELIPVKDVREYCSLIEEKNALLIEIRQAEEDAKRKRIIKKKYKNILTNNTAKIQEIDKEIVPFKKILIETSPNFENIVKMIDLLEAERQSVKDALNLLESRYKKGRLPSKAVYIKLADQYYRRQKKIDKGIDKSVQQLRSYLL